MNMTAEEKAKAYDEALEKAKDCLKDGTITSTAIDYIETIFPELKESEDEKIRKEIIAFIKKRNRSGCDYDYDKWIAWLEKQKDINSKEYVFRPLVGCDINTAAIQAVEQQKLGNKVVLAFNGAYIPVEEKTTDDIVNEYYSWLEKKGEKKQEWSEDDETMRENIEGALDCYESMVSEDWEREKEWLKSLKERITWKPSKEQIHAFEQVYEWYNDNFAPSETLTSLYNDLKKL